MHHVAANFLKFVFAKNHENWLMVDMKVISV